MNMAMTALRSPSRLAARDLSPGHAIGLAFASAITLAIVDSALHNGLGLLFGMGYVLIVVTAPLSVAVGKLFVPAILPPLLLTGTLTAMIMFMPSALPATDSAEPGPLQLLIAGVIDQAWALVVGHVCAVIAVGLRILTAPSR